MTTIIDYGAGNLRSVQNTLDELRAPYIVTNSAADVESATKILLPGVGHFGQMMTALDRLDLRTTLRNRIIGGVPFLGICLGLQCLFESSEEAPDKEGFGVFPGQIRRFTGAVRIPHMGWNTLTALRPSKLLAGLEESPYTYFAHSFYAPVVEATAATCTYSLPYTAVVESNNIYGVQFHPEKSGASGLKVIENFVNL